MKRKTKEPIPDFSEVTVTLKPILGIRPGIYLMIIYGVIILAVLFVLFFVPGLYAAGSYVNFSSGPVPAGVWIDGKKAGVTPCEVLVHEGRHEVRIERPGYKPVTMTRDVTRFVFALPFLPKREFIETPLEAADVTALVRTAYNDFSGWASIEAFAGDYPYPPVLTETAMSIYASPTEDTYRALHNLLERTLPFVHLPELAFDWFSAYYIVETRGRGPTAAAAFDTVAGLRRLLGRYDNLPFFLYAMLPQQIARTHDTAAGGPSPYVTRADLDKEEWFRTKTDGYRAFLSRFTPSRGAMPGPAVSVGGVQFLPVPAGTFIMGRFEKEGSLLGPNFLALFPHPQRVKGFYMARTEVTNAQFRSFLREKPDWRPDNRDKLKAAHLVDDFYLKDWRGIDPPAGKENFPVIYVSAYAAEAYCDWLSGKLGSSVPRARVRLPYEAEWEWAADGGSPSRFKTSGSRFYAEFSAGLKPSGSSAPNVFGLTDMAGNAYELCRDWFALSAPLVSSSDPEKNVYDRYNPFTTGQVKAVRGGSWATPSEKIEAYTRGGQPSNASTPFLGFRPVIGSE
ncbi:MAG: SUMF1/EgtB/PvdO family nonheme iron enzyme [Spirochaetales bacterium]|nr:SUMF1/EgtB/PvdO family nonheme iron enzyme [Spirochaetales bacterium]